MNRIMNCLRSAASVLFFVFAFIVLFLPAELMTGCAMCGAFILAVAGFLIAKGKTKGLMGALTKAELVYALVLTALFLSMLSVFEIYTSGAYRYAAIADAYEPGLIARALSLSMLAFFTPLTAIATFLSLAFFIHSEKTYNISPYISPAAPLCPDADVVLSRSGRALYSAHSAERDLCVGCRLFAKAQ